MVTYIHTTCYKEQELISKRSDEDKLEGKVPGLLRQLWSLWRLHSTQNETKQPEEGKLKTRKDSEDELAAARRLWFKCESLVYDAVACEDGSETMGVLAESKKLLTACDELIALKEGILRVYDLDADTYTRGCEITYKYL